MLVGTKNGIPKAELNKSMSVSCGLNKPDGFCLQDNPAAALFIYRRFTTRHVVMQVSSDNDEG